MEGGGLRLNLVGLDALRDEESHRLVAPLAQRPVGGGALGRAALDDRLPLDEVGDDPLPGRAGDADVVLFGALADFAPSAGGDGGGPDHANGESHGADRAEVDSRGRMCLFDRVFGVHC